MHHDARLRGTDVRNRDCFCSVVWRVCGQHDRESGVFPVRTDNRVDRQEDINVGRVDVGASGVSDIPGDDVIAAARKCHRSVRRSDREPGAAVDDVDLHRIESVSAENIVARRDAEVQCSVGRRQLLAAGLS